MSSNNTHTIYQMSHHKGGQLLNTSTSVSAFYNNQNQQKYIQLGLGKDFDLGNSVFSPCKSLSETGTSSSFREVS